MEKSLGDLSAVLRRLHKALIDVEAVNFGPISGPFQLLNLVAHHPRFAWLHTLSELMVDLDELLEEAESADTDQAAVLRTTIEQLVGPRAPLLSRFREHYVALLQHSPEVAMAHAELRRVLNDFPDPASTDPLE